ncbi:carbohydrate kinase family protein [Nocardia abscessus]|uniref:carbohydrate kinase family protein n=1 Tax=Nocardia abscessus TaxID=120957 RepID=UPI0005B91B30|nr:carbohydrate kinase family protein [Nocardia abscessus]MCC3328874.1 carbohydrate kinase family protein [Nocardia abscessus]
MTLQSGPVVCVSYLALAELWNLPRFPAANHGAEIRSIEWSVAADGPMTAAALASLGAPSLLLSNDIGDDEQGQYVRRWLEERRVERAFAIRSEVVTPRVVVAADDDHTRTWFAHLPAVVGSLERADLSPIASASFLYLDCYQLIERAALRVIEAGRAVEVPMLLNLGGSELSQAMASAIRGCAGLVIQTNVDDAAHAAAPEVARSLLVQTGAAWVVVTAGAFGAIAVSRSETVSAPSFPVEVRHTHCAGAAFSAGLLYGLRSGWSMHRGMLLGSASGAFRCARHQSAPLPSLDELRAVIASRPQSVAS